MPGSRVPFGDAAALQAVLYDEYYQEASAYDRLSGRQVQTTINQTRCPSPSGVPRSGPSAARARLSPDQEGPAFARDPTDILLVRLSDEPPCGREPAGRRGLRRMRSQQRALPRARSLPLLRPCTTGPRRRGSGSGSSTPGAEKRSPVRPPEWRASPRDRPDRRPGSKANVAGQDGAVRRRVLLPQHAK